jgi:hypothetical protein
MEEQMRGIASKAHLYAYPVLHSHKTSFQQAVDPSFRGTSAASTVGRVRARNSASCTRNERRRPDDGKAK